LSAPPPGDCLARIRNTGDSFLLLKNNQPVAELVPLAATKRATLRDLWEAWRDRPVDEAFADDLEKVNATDRLFENPWDWSSTRRR